MQLHMNTRLSIFKGGLNLGASQVVTQSCSFARNVILARFISPSNFGIAATMAMTWTLFEAMSNVAMEVLIVQAEYGNEVRFQNTAQLLRAGRGLMNATLIFLLAGPASRLFGVPEVRWAFRCLALVPLIKGFAHLDLNRFQREMRFGPAVRNDVTASLLATAAAWPLAVKLHDYSAMLCLLIAQTAFLTIGSHLVAERSYGWSWDSSYVRQIGSFGWPLVINALLLIVIYDGDRFVIGSARRLFPQSAYSLADLGIYAAAFAVAMAPAVLAGSVCQSLLLPFLSRMQDARTQFERRYAVSAEGVALIAVIMTVFFIVAGPSFVVLVYGKKYAAARAVIGLLGAMWGVRTLWRAPNVAAMALGDTKTSMVSNIARTTAFPAMLLATWAGCGLPWIAACGLGGELVALAVSVWRLQRRHAIPARLCWRGLALFGTGAILAVLAVWTGLPGADWKSAFVVAAGLVILLSIVMLATFPGLRALIFKSESPTLQLATQR